MSVSKRSGVLVTRIGFGLLLTLHACVSQADDWPQFRGPNSAGIAEGSKPLPVKFSATENLRWSADVGEGVGGAAVAAGRVFVSGMTGANRDTISLFAFDAETGERLWEREWPAGTLPEIHQTNSHASSTPAADAEQAYFYFTTLGLVALDARTGEKAWTQKLPAPFFVFKWGAGVSPVVYKNMVLFCQDDDLNPALYAIDKATGKLLWKDDRLDMAVNYSHPVINTVDGRDEIVVAGTGMLIGYDPETGKRLWFAKTLLRNIKTTPVCAGGNIYVSLQSSGIANQWLAAVDQAATGNSDGKISKQEIEAFVGAEPLPPQFLRRAFERGDRNHDGLLEGEELDLAFMHPDNFSGARYTSTGAKAADEFILAVRGGGLGDVTDSHLLWKHATKHTDHVVSPFVSDGRMLLIKCGGISTVFDTASGKPLRGPKRIADATDYFASPVAGDGKIYAAGSNGMVVVLADKFDLVNDDAYEELAVNDVGGSIVATPAIADGKLFVRTREKLLCFGE